MKNPGKQMGEAQHCLPLAMGAQSHRLSLWKWPLGSLAKGDSAPAGSRLLLSLQGSRRESTSKGEQRLPWTQAGSVTFPPRPGCESSGWLFPPKPNKIWMLSSLSLGRRCCHKGLALDLPLCDKQQNLACFLGWEDVQYPSAGHLNNTYSISPCSEGSHSTTRVHSVLLLPLLGQILG